MFKKIILLALLLVCCRQDLTYALDWKRLHEKADTLRSSEFVAIANESGTLQDLYVLGLTYLNEYKDDQAREAFERIAALDEGIIEAQWGLAEVLRRKHQRKECIGLIDEVFKSNPGFAPALITLAYVRFVEADFNAAVRLAIKVLQQGERRIDQSNYVRAHLIYAGAKGMIAHFGGPFSKVVNGAAVLKSLHAAGRLKPQSAAVKFGLGSYYLLIPSALGRDLKKAEKLLVQAIAIDPFLTDAYVRLAQCYKLMNDSGRFNEYLEKALAVDPQNELALDIKSNKCRFVCLDD